MLNDIIPLIQDALSSPQLKHTIRTNYLDALSVFSEKHDYCMHIVKGHKSQIPHATVFTELVSLKSGNILKNNLTTASKFFDGCSSNIICLNKESKSFGLSVNSKENLISIKLQGHADAHKNIIKPFLETETLFQLHQGKAYQNVMDKELKNELDLTIQSSTIITNPLNYYGDVIKFTKEYIARRGVGVEIVNDKVTDFLIQQELVKITHPEVGAKF